MPFKNPTSSGSFRRRGQPLLPNETVRPIIPFRPWVVRNRAEVLDYVSSLSSETHEWLLALYVDVALNLLSVETVERGSVSGIDLDFGLILCRGRSLAAAGFILVHNHPSGELRASAADIVVTQRLRRASLDVDLPLLDHFIVAGGDIAGVGHW